MPNKDALRELQVRLAQRLQAVREQPREQGWLAVEAQSVGLLLPLAQAGEIHAARELLTVPHAVDWLSGVASLRGELHAVVDLARFLGLRQTAPATGGQLVALNANLRVNCALRVDRLLGLREASQFEVCEQEPDVHRPPFAGGRWRDASGRVWQALDLAALASDPRFLDVAWR